MNHTKRTPEFCAKIDRLVHLVQRNVGTSSEDIALSVEDVEDLTKILMLNTTDSPCIVKAAADEPLFVLRGQDMHASDLVRKWASKFRSQLANQPNADQTKGLAKTFDAEHCATKMENYKGRRAPD